MKYKFVTNDDDTEIKDNRLTTYYQVCIFPHPKTKKYQVRKFVINSQDRFVDIKDYFLIKKEMKKFMASKMDHEYKCFSVYDLRQVNPPSLFDIQTCRSTTLSHNYDYYGYAPF